MGPVPKSLGPTQNCMHRGRRKLGAPNPPYASRYCQWLRKFDKDVRSNYAASIQSQTQFRHSPPFCAGALASVRFELMQVNHMNIRTTKHTNNNPVSETYVIGLKLHQTVWTSIFVFTQIDPHHVCLAGMHFPRLNYRQSSCYASMTS